MAYLEEKEEKFLDYLFFFTASYLILSLSFIILFPAHRSAMYVFAAIICCPFAIFWFSTGLWMAWELRDALIEYLKKKGRLNFFTKTLCYAVCIPVAILGFIIFFILICIAGILNLFTLLNEFQRDLLNKD